MFVKVTETSNRSSQNVFDILKQVIAVYQDELKREDLTAEQREDIYDRMDKYAIHAREQDESNKTFMNAAMGVMTPVLVGGAVKFGPKIIKSVMRK